MPHPGVSTPVTRAGQLRFATQNRGYTQWGAGSATDRVAQALRVQAAKQIVHEGELRYQNIYRSWMGYNALIKQEVAYSSAVMARRSGQAIISQALMNFAGQFTSLLEVFDQALKDTIEEQYRARMMDIYSEVALKATEDVIAAYKSSLKKRNLQYRGADPDQWKRYTGGLLENALRGNLFRVTPEGIEYIIAPMLDRAAPQWYRLNFGTMPKGGVAPKAYSIHLFGTSVSGPDLRNFEPSRAFKIPKGYWAGSPFSTTAEFMQNRNGFTPGGSAFYPVISNENTMFEKGSAKPPAYEGRLLRGGTGRVGRLYRGLPVRATGAAAGVGGNFSKEPRISQGIFGTGFLDVGMATVNRLMGPALEYMFREWATKAGGDATASVTEASGPLAHYGQKMNTQWVDQMWLHVAGDVSEVKYQRKGMDNAITQTNLRFQRELDSLNKSLTGLDMRRNGAGHLQTQKSLMRHRWTRGR